VSVKNNNMFGGIKRSTLFKGIRKAAALKANDTESSLFGNLNTQYNAVIPYMNQQRSSNDNSVFLPFSPMNESSSFYI